MENILTTLSDWIVAVSDAVCGYPYFFLLIGGELTTQSTSVVGLGSNAAGSVAYEPANAPPTYTSRSFRFCMPSAISCKRSLLVFDIVLDVFVQFCNSNLFFAGTSHAKRVGDDQ